VTLDRLIAHHRALYADELRRPFHMTVSQVPDETEPILIGEEVVEVTDSGPLGGPPFSRPMNRHLGPIDGYGAQRPWSYSWHALRKACRNDHPGHTERRTFGGSLCWQAVSYAVVSNYNLETVAEVLSDPPFLISVEDAERHLTRAFGWIEEHMDRGQQIRNARDPQPSEEPTPSRLSLLVCDAAHRQVADFDLEQRIWESQARLHPELGLADWSDEWARRLNILWAHQQECDRCRRAA
jgi:hypothetical protein